MINDAPYGTEKAYNALRMAMQPGKEHEDVEVRGLKNGIIIYYASRIIGNGVEDYVYNKTV